jgi:hypothetical protein
MLLLRVLAVLLLLSLVFPHSLFLIKEEEEEEDTLAFA